LSECFLFVRKSESPEIRMIIFLYISSAMIHLSNFPSSGLSDFPTSGLSDLRTYGLSGSTYFLKSVVTLACAVGVITSSLILTCFGRDTANHTDSAISSATNGLKPS